MDWPRDAAVPSHIHTYTEWMVGPQLRLSAGVSASAGSMTWTANVALYVPLWLPVPYNVRRVFWQNGSAAGGNLDLGIYTPGQGRIYHTGSTVGSGNTAPQYVTPASDIQLSPGQYFLALALDNATANRIAGVAVAADLGRQIGLLQQATAFALPGPAVFAAYAGVGLPIFGITNTDAGF